MHSPFRHSSRGTRAVAAAHRDAQHSIMASGRSGADIAKGTAGSFAPATKDAASDLASKTVGLVTKAEFTRVRAR